MDRVPEQALPRITWMPESIGWRLIGTYVPIAALALAAVLIFKGMAGDDAPASPLAVVPANHSQVLAANIAFFEERVRDTNDSLSYNRLTNLYLQRLRETGDAADVQRAEASAQRSLEVAPGEYAGLVNLAQVRLAQHDFVGAEAAAGRAHTIIPTRADAFALLGDAQMAMGRYDEASANYRVFLDKAPGSAAFIRQAALAEVYGSVPLAEQFWTAAIDADRGDAPEASAWARVQLANLYFVNGRTADAGNEYRTALRVYPGYGAAEAGLGRVAAAKGDFGAAARHYAAAAEKLPTPEYVVTLGDVYARARKTAEAQRQFGLAGAIESLFATNGIRNDLTLILFSLDHGGDSSEALARAEAAYRDRPSLAAADVYAWALYRSGRFEEADAASREALRFGSKEPLYLYHAGAISAARGDTAGASEYLAAALKLNPEFSVQHAPDAVRLLKSLREGAR